jgi:hypothetical protein
VIVKSLEKITGNEPGKYDTRTETHTRKTGSVNTEKYKNKKTKEWKN